MILRNYFELFFSSKVWLEIAERRGKDETLVIYAVFNFVIFLIISIGLSYALPSVFTSSNLWVSTAIAVIVSTWSMRTYLEKNLGAKQPINSEEKYPLWFRLLAILALLVLALLRIQTML